MTKDTVTFHRILYVFLLAALNVVGFIMIGVVFLGATNANGESAPIESTFVGFLRQLAYVVIVSLFFSFVAFLLTCLFHKSISKNNLFIKKIFWVHLGGMVAIFLIAYLYLWIMFDS